MFIDPEIMEVLPTRSNKKFNHLNSPKLGVDESSQTQIQAIQARLNIAY